MASADAVEKAYNDLMLHDPTENGSVLTMTERASPIVAESARSKIFRKCLGAYLFQLRRIWNHMPASFHHMSAGWMYGTHLHYLVRLHADRKQYFATFFLRNRAELELLRRLVDHKGRGSGLKISVLACSKGAEVYSILWVLRSARPDLKLSMHAVDISQEILEFAERGVYSRKSLDAVNAPSRECRKEKEDVIWNTCRDQNAPIFERVTEEEVQAMCEVEGDQATVKAWLREGITWCRADANDPELVNLLGPQDIVVANRFLCHMTPVAAENCLGNIARLVKPGGYLFVSGIDLDVRARVAKSMGWKPVPDLIREIHEGDASLRKGWPVEYWGLEPFCDSRSDWEIRYASVFQIGLTA
jgi:chemotaxis methyl-accepting protein methylase